MNLVSGSVNKMNDALKKYFNQKTKKELIAMCYELHCENMKLQGYKVWRKKNE